VEESSGLRAILERPAIYSLFQWLVGGHTVRRRFAASHVRAVPGQRVVDIGCGPVPMLNWLPAVDYVGFDVSAPYIDAARARFGSRGTFIVGDSRSLRDDPRLQNADIVVCVATLHHLNDDDALALIEFAHGILKPGGRFVCGEPCWAPHQGALSRWLMSRDRGARIRTEAEYRNLVGRCFRNVVSVIDEKPLRIPSAGCNMECQK